MTATDFSQQSTRRVLARAFVEAPSLARGLIWTVVLALVGTALKIVVPILVQQIIDSGVEAGAADMAVVLQRAALAIAAMVLSALAARAAIRRLAKSAAWGLSELRVKTFRHLHRQSALHMQAEKRGVLVSRVTADVETIQKFMDWAGIGMLVGAAQLTLAAAVMLFYSWQLTIVVVVGVVSYGVMLAWFQRVLSRAHDQVRGRVAATLSAMGEAIAGLTVIRAYGSERSAIDRVGTALNEQFEDEYRTGKLGALLFSSAELFAGSLTAAVIVAGIWLGVDNGVTAGTLLAFLFLVNLLVEPVQTLVESLDTAQSAGAGLRRILGVVDTPIDIPEAEEPVAVPGGGLAIDVADVTFTYPGGDTAVHNVSTHFPAGARIAVVGETGSGKTTFAKLIARLLEVDEGVITLSGVPIQRIAFAELRSRVAFVPQEGFLFDTDIGGNVRYGRPQASDEEVRAAFGDLGLTDWLDGLEAGIATLAGEGGSQLSSGERQLVALVRAWIADPDLLVLDEATSAVDPALEVKIRAAIEQLTEGRTSITVAHRLSTAEAADTVLVFADGEVVERGTHIELLASGGVYADLYADWEQGTTASTTAGDA